MRCPSTRLIATLALLLASVPALAGTTPEPRLTPVLVERYIAVLQEIQAPEARLQDVAARHGFAGPSALAAVGADIHAALLAVEERRFIASIERERALIMARARSEPDADETGLSLVQATLDRDAPVPEPRHQNVADADIDAIAPHEQQLRLLRLEAREALESLVER